MWSAEPSWWCSGWSLLHLAKTPRDVRATVIGSDETKSPLLVEHLNFARRHASLLVFCGLTPRSEHPLPFGRGIVLPLLDQALLMDLEVGYTLPDLLALRVYPLHGRHPVRFNNGTRHRWFDMKASCKRHRFFDERISFPTGHSDPQSSSYRAERKASMCCELEGVDAVDNRRRDAFPTRRANPKVAAGLVEKAAFERMLRRFPRPADRIPHAVHYAGGNVWPAFLHDLMVSVFG